MVAESAMRPTNSKNCVARTIVYGIAEAWISFSWATFARKYPLAGSRSEPTIESSNVVAYAGFRLGGEDVARSRFRRIPARPCLPTKEHL